jgi:hypothetical protein
MDRSDSESIQSTDLNEHRKNDHAVVQSDYEFHRFNLGLPGDL